MTKKIPHTTTSPEGHTITLEEIGTFEKLTAKEWVQVWKILGCKLTPGNNIKPTPDCQLPYAHLTRGCIACASCQQPIKWNNLGGIFKSIWIDNKQDLICADKACLQLYMWEREDHLEEQLTNKLKQATE